jgi:hypothetical protein
MAIPRPHLSALFLPFPVTGLSLDAGHSIEDHELPCPQCNTDMVVSQPDPTRPVQLLGTCPSCGHWCAIADTRSTSSSV